MRYIRRLQINSYDKQIKKLNWLLSGLNPAFWPREFDEAWNDRALCLQKRERLLNKEQK